MKIFTNKNFAQKLILAIVCVILLNFCIAPGVQAASFGGKMMGLIRSFATSIADVVGSLVQFGVTGNWIWAIDEKGSGEPDEENDYWIKSSKFQYPILQVSPELIFANKIQMLDVNFISDIKDSDEYTIGLDDTSALQKLRNIVAGWYVTLRTIAIVGLLSVLIYIGIRIIISSTASDRAKYKQRLMDWVAAFCLLFIMHYIMAATITVVQKVNDVLASNAHVDEGLDINPKYGTVKYNPTLSSLGASDVAISRVKTMIAEALGVEESKIEVADNGTTGDTHSDRTQQWIIKANGKNQGNLNYSFQTGKYSFSRNPESGEGIITEADGEKVREYLAGMVSDEESENGGTAVESTEGGASIVASGNGAKVRVATEAVNGDGSKVLYFTNYARLFLNVKNSDEYIPMATAYLIIYIALITFTAMFAIRYMKRVIYIAFLTLIAPMVALTYPLDKIKDRKSTGLEYVV